MTFHIAQHSIAQHPNSHTNEQSVVQKRDSLHNQIMGYINLLLKHNNKIEDMEHNLDLLKQMKFDDFTGKGSNKRNLEKQIDFYGNSRKIRRSDEPRVFSCLLYGESISDKEKIGASESLINSYLEMIANSFTTEDKLVKVVKCVDAQEMQIDFAGNDDSITFVPLRQNGIWQIKIIHDSNVSMPSHFSDILPYQSGYAILLMATQTLTKAIVQIDAQLLTRFRKFLKQIFENDNLFGSCYRCFRSNNLEECGGCPLTYCRHCIKIGCQLH